MGILLLCGNRWRVKRKKSTENVERTAVANSVERYDIRPLSYRKGLLRCENNAFVSYSLKDNKERARFIIPQNKEGIDIVDRIQYFKDNRKDNDYWIYQEG